MEEAFDDIEEFVVVLVFVPVVFALDHAEADDGVVHLAERLVEPLVRAGGGQRLFVDQLERPELDVEPRDVGEFRRISHAPDSVTGPAPRNVEDTVPVG